MVKELKIELSEESNVLGTDLRQSILSQISCLAAERKIRQSSKLAPVLLSWQRLQRLTGLRGRKIASRFLGQSQPEMGIGFYDYIGKK